MTLVLYWLLALSVVLFWLIRQRLAVESATIRRTAPLANPPGVSIVIPARNEAANIGACLAGLTAQTYPADALEIVVIDDKSTDGTGDIVREWASRFPFIKLVEGQPLPDGWTGKSNACAVGTRHATREYLMFTDADTKAAPELVASTVRFAQDRKIDLLSMHPFQELGTFWEKLFMPTAFISISMSMDLFAANDPDHEEALATGQFMLFRRSAYDAVGGHAAVKSEFLEDIAFAQLIKQTGHRSFMGYSDRLISTRMYPGLASYWMGFSRSFTHMTRGPFRAMLFPLLMAVLIGWLPLFVLFMAPRLIDVHAPMATPMLSLAIAAGVIISIAVNFFTALHHRVSPLYAILAPFAHLGVTAVAFNSVRWRLLNHNVWKGRVYTAHRNGTARLSLS